jgi:hypothetical protein
VSDEVVPDGEVKDGCTCRSAIQYHLDDEGWTRRSALEEITFAREMKEVEELLEEIARIKTVLEEADGRPSN